MPVLNAEKYVVEAIESVLKQSFRNFEFIIIDDGSHDNTKKIIKSFKDKRILFVENKHDFIGSLNLGIQKSTGKYIVRMDADDIMHIDRLRIQYAIMEEEPNITVCSTWMFYIGEKTRNGSIAQTLHGLVENPLIELLLGNFIFHPTTMIRKDFLDKYNLQYQHYDYAEDYKLWFEIVKKGGVLYIESQPLLYYRISENQVTHTKKEEQTVTTDNIRLEILEYLVNQNRANYGYLDDFYRNFISLKKDKLIDSNLTYSFFYNFFKENKNKLKVT